MAIAFDAASHSRTSSATSLTFAHTCSGSDRLLAVSVVGRTADTITGVTYNGVSLSLAAKTAASGGRYTYLYLLVAPATGSNNVVISGTGSDYIEGNAASYTGAAQTGQPNVTGTNSTSLATALATSCTTTVDNCWVVLAADGQSGTLTAGSGTTLRATDLVGAILDSGGAVTPAGAKTLNHNQASSQIMAGVVAAIAPALNSVTITSPVQYKTVQRSGSAGSISITGTYVGSPTAIEASFNGGSYATIDAAPSGGTYSGTLSSQSEGQGTLTVRFTNNTSVLATVSDVGIGDVFVVVGDSIAEGRGTNAQSYTHATLKATKFTEADAWGNGNDGIDTGTSSGSHWPLLATQIMADQSVPVAFVSAAAGTSDVAGTHNEWAKNNSGYAAMTSQITDSGVNAVKAVLIHLGPNAVVDSSTISQATYNTAIDTLAGNVVADIAGAPKLHIGIFGEVSTGSPPDRTASLNNMRAAIIEAHGDNTNVKPGPCLIDQDYSDGVHPQSDAALAAVAGRWWVALKESLYSGSGGRGPRLSYARWNTARDELTVVFDRTLKTGLTHGTACWAVSDNGSAMTVSSIAYHSTNAAAIVLTMSAAAVGAAGTTTITFANGDTAVGQVVPLSADITMPSGAAIQIPAEPIYSAAVEEPPTATITLTTDGTTPAASLSSLKWAWFDEVTPNLFGAPTDQGSAESTDGSGVLVLSLPNTSLASSEIGWLIVTDSDGTTTQTPAHKLFAGPVAVD